MYVIKKSSILFIGNGVLQAFGGEGWDKFLDSIKKRTDIDHRINCPAPLKAIVLTNDHVDKAIKEKFENSRGMEITNPELADYLQKILSVGFDHIMTTNYTYELEAASVYPEALSDYRLKKMQKCSKGRCESRYLLHTYREFTFGNTPNKLWHIHGEARKNESVVLGHYYYGNLLHSVMKEIEDLDNYRFKNNGETKESWIEAFLFGDVYCLGFGFGVCEFDLWWLLNRKAREKGNTGRVYFYEPYEKEPVDSKLELLKVLRTTEDEKLVEHITLGYEKEELKNDYSPFYISALEDIKLRFGVFATSNT